MTVIDNEEVFTLHEVCALLDEKEYNIRYEEKIMGLELITDDKNNKYYTKENIDLLQFLKEYKSKGLELKTIKMAMEGNIIKFAEDNIESKEIIELKDTKDYKNELSNIHVEKSIAKENGNVNKTMKLLMSGMSIDVFKKMVQIEQSIEGLRTDIDKQTKKISYKIDKTVEGSTKDIINENKNNIKEINRKLENKDIELVNNLVSKMKERKLVFNSKKKESFFKRIFK